MNASDLPPPRAGFGLQREMDELQANEGSAANTALKAASPLRETGSRRRVSFLQSEQQQDGGARSSPIRLNPSGTPAGQATGPVLLNPSTSSPAAAALNSSGSDMSLSLNASMRRTRRRHAAAAAAAGPNILGPAPLPPKSPRAVDSLFPVPGNGAADGGGGGGDSNAGASSSGAAPAASPWTTATSSFAGSHFTQDGEGASVPTTPAPASAPPRDAAGAVPGTPGAPGALGGAISVVHGRADTAAGGTAGEQPPDGSDPPEDPIYSSLYTKPIPPNVLAITIARSEDFRHDPLLTNPIVRVHVLDPATGRYLETLENPELGMLGPQQQVALLEAPGRPAAMTVGNNTAAPAAALLRAIPPVQTEPYDLLSRPEARTLAAWEETLLIDEAVERVVAVDALLLFEVLQPPESYRRYRKHMRSFDPLDGAHLVAWGFLRPAGPPPPAPGAPRQPLLGRLKLQLYEYKKDISSAVGAATAAATAGAISSSGGAAGLPSHVNAASRAYLNYQFLMARGGAAVVPKYPSALTVVLQAVPRPEAEVVVTEPERNIRPYLPAGYGSGFETSRVPLSAYLQGADAGEGLGGTVLGGIGGGIEDITQHPLYRPVTEPCKVPNQSLRKLPGGPCGVTALAFSHSGLYLAVAAAEADDRMRLAVYKTLTGALSKVEYGAHSGFVYEVAWARDDSALVTASADGTAKIWELNPAAAAAAMAVAEVAASEAVVGAAAAAGGGGGVADAPAAAAAAAPTMNLLATTRPSRQASPPTPANTLNATRRGTTPPAANGAPSAATAAAAAAAAAAATAATRPGHNGLPPATVLRHACYVYSAVFHPVQKAVGALVATGAYDGTVRLWRRYTGELLAAVKTQNGCINSLCFDKLGTRLYAGDSAGVLQEFSCDVSKGAEALAAAPGGTNLKISTIASGTPSGFNSTSSLRNTTLRNRLSGSVRSGTPGGGSSALGGGGGGAAVALNASMLPRSNFNASITMRAAAAAGAAAAAAAGTAAAAAGEAAGAAGGGGGGGLNATATSVGGDSSGAAASANILRVLRQCDEFDGEPLSHLFLHHDGRRLGVLTKRSRLMVLETRSLSRAETFLGARCREAPIKAAFSPDGRYLLCGSEDGRVVAWDADGGPPTLLPHFSLGGDTVYQIAWNSQFHILAVCSFASWAPVLMLSYDKSLPEVIVPRGVKSGLELMAQERKRGPQVARPRWDIPDRLTPEYLRIMLQDVRRDATDRGILGRPDDPHGDHLVLPRRALTELRQGQAAAAGAAAAARGPRVRVGRGQDVAPTSTSTPSTPSAHRPAAGTAGKEGGGSGDMGAILDTLPSLPSSRFPTSVPISPSPSPMLTEGGGEGAAAEKSTSLPSRLSRQGVTFAGDQPLSSASPPAPESSSQQGKEEEGLVGSGAPLTSPPPATTAPGGDLESRSEGQRPGDSTPPDQPGRDGAEGAASEGADASAGGQGAANNTPVAATDLATAPTHASETAAEVAATASAAAQVPPPTSPLVATTAPGPPPHEPQLQRQELAQVAPGPVEFYGQEQLLQRQTQQRYPQQQQQHQQHYHPAQQQQQQQQQQQYGGYGDHGGRQQQFTGEQEYEWRRQVGAVSPAQYSQLAAAREVERRQLASSGGGAGGMGRQYPPHPREIQLQQYAQQQQMYRQLYEREQRLLYGQQQHQPYAGQQLQLQQEQQRFLEQQQYDQGLQREQQQQPLVLQPQQRQAAAYTARQQQLHAPQPQPHQPPLYHHPQHQPLDPQYAQHPHLPDASLMPAWQQGVVPQSPAGWGEVQPPQFEGHHQWAQTWQPPPQSPPPPFSPQVWPAATSGAGATSHQQPQPRRVAHTPPVYPVPPSQSMGLYAPPPSQVGQLKATHQHQHQHPHPHQQQRPWSAPLVQPPYGGLDHMPPSSHVQQQQQQQRPQYGSGLQQSAGPAAPHYYVTPVQMTQDAAPYAVGAGTAGQYGASPGYAVHQTPYTGTVGRVGYAVQQQVSPQPQQRYGSLLQAQQQRAY